MQVDEFRRIVSTFSDPGSSMLFEKNRILFSLNGNTIEATLSTMSGDIYVDEGQGPVAASIWIMRRLANLPLLATRILEQIPKESNFIPPAAKILPSLSLKPDGVEVRTEDALNTLLSSLEEESPLETTVLYITSDAGEGKTWLINAAAREQALKFNQSASDWLLVPIGLGGRHFLRFDDITVGALQNKYRFPFLYYNSFLALVRMGIIVPAFDGFEEMFVENSSGEALSAMGILVGALSSAGAVVVAARKAYFEFENLKSQEKLYDTIGSYAVGFSKLELIRWEKPQFLAYCTGRDVKRPEEIYDQVRSRLGDNHSLLTRPVLVRRLVDIAKENPELDIFLEKIKSSGADFFSVFVRGIIEREAVEKWVDRSGHDLASSLLSTDEHCDLLAMISVSMWETRVDYLKREYLDVVTDFYCESRGKTPQQSHQIRERIRGHALLVASADVASAVAFDHDEFRQFFLGEGLAEIVSPRNASQKSEALSVLRREILPEHSQLAFVRAVERKYGADRLNISKMLVEIGGLDGHASYTQENCSSLIIRLLSQADASGLEIVNLAFGVEALRDCKLKNVIFNNCYFGQSNFDRAVIEKCVFRRCKFTQIRLYSSTVFLDVSFENSSVDSVRNETTSVENWEPASVMSQLKARGVSFSQDLELPGLDVVEESTMDEELISVGKMLRYFMRSTHIGESVMKIRLGANGQSFIDECLPKLLDRKIMVEIENRGGNTQRRFKLGRPLKDINACLSSAAGSFSKFVEDCALH